MAEFIISNWKITWDPAGAALVLLDHGERMLAEPLIGQGHDSELVPFARAGHPVGFHYGNVGHPVSFSRAVDHVSQEAARNSKLSHLVVTGALRVADVKIEVLDGASYWLRNCVLQDVTGNMGPEHGTAITRVLWEYQLAGGKLEAVV